MRAVVIAVVACAALAVAGCTAGAHGSAARSPAAAATGGGFTSIHGACQDEPSVCAIDSVQPTGPLPAAFTRPLRLPPVPPGGRCPVTRGARAYVPEGFRGVFLGTGPVRPDVGGYTDRTQRDSASGIAYLEPTTTDGWHAFKTLWIVNADYTGPVLIRGARLDRPGALAFSPDSPTADSQLVIPAGRTLNEYHGMRSAPGATLVHGPGCYGYQVDGPGLSETIVVNVRPPLS